MKFYEALRNRRVVRMMKEKDKKGRFCCYPFGDVRSGNLRFCEKLVERERFVYCDDHARLCYTNFEEIKDKPRSKLGRK